ncbi:MAG TPA: MFS transporter [Flavobacteriales bacterium]|jgi:MFS family permease|nr:MHS family MFS transporter [Flavobacteriales bacterium]MBK7103461.1 MHS family MFS transporter [Flavobacteriales bacterium]MBK7114059.1 MHS family MFS transporter [Flavobacteriales bacterium]MBK7483876.1 MHS family MFS transporter [Flavobacteriales bacterium]MBK7619974.1 MHS family MFS transporter [Flavobacteriales bacterium]
MDQPANQTKNLRKVIWASSLGTLIEWYDFYIFGSLATVIAGQFFPKENPTAALLSTLATFAAGFIVRPFGALVFGRIGDMVGRKYTFLLTLVIMGGSTFAIGLVPGYATIGFAAPIIILVLRLLQGLALGGEYGGAATYVAEHAPAGRRGFYTSWIQTTATLGLFVSLGVILLTRQVLDSDPSVSISKFNDWGWRIPFLLSSVLVVISVYIRMKMSESPMFAELKAEGKTSKNPLKESFGHKTNLKMVLLALFGTTMGQGVVWYTGQFYAQSFLENVCRVDFAQSRTILIWSILFATPFFVVFGHWSDRIGRKWIMLIGMALAVVTYRPLFRMMERISDPTHMTEVNEPFALSEHVFDAPQPDGAITEVTRTHRFTNGTVVTGTYSYNAEDVIVPRGGKDGTVNKQLGPVPYWQIVGIIFIMILYVTMVYGPIAAFLVELFPTRIRYTSMSLPYHVGNGVFGGLTPFIATLLTTIHLKDPLVGLWYPIGVAALCFIIGALYVKEDVRPNAQTTDG